MHTAIIYIRNESGDLVREVKTTLSFTPELQTIIYHNGVKSRVSQVIIDITPPIPAIIITAVIK